MLPVFVRLILTLPSPFLRLVRALPVYPAVGFLVDAVLLTAVRADSPYALNFQWVPYFFCCER